MLKSFRMFATQAEWDEEVARISGSLKQNTGETDLATFGAKLIAERVRDNPHCYAEFGVYWFAVKDVLARHGYDLGETMDETMRDEYRGTTDAHTIVAAEKFKDEYRKTYFKHTTHFTLVDDDGSEWILSDPEMAARVA